MRKISLLVHISLDGFVSGPNGEFDHFPKAEENLDFVAELTDDADTALFGRKSFEMMNDYWLKAKDEPNAPKGQIKYSNWYNKIEKYVVSKTIEAGALTKTTIINNGIIARVKELKNQAGKDIQIYGSPTLVRELLEHDLIDVYWIFINPVLFGKGIPLFADTDKVTKFKLEKTHQLSNGEIAMKYVLLQ